MFFFSKKITIKKTRSLNKLHHLFDMSPPFAFVWFFTTILTVIPKIDTIIVIVWLQSYQNPSPAISQRSELGQLAANNLQGPVPKLSSTALFCCKKESKSEKSPSPVWLSTTLISSSSWGGKIYISRNIAKGTAHSARHCLLVQNKRWLQIFTNLHLQIWFKFF